MDGGCKKDQGAGHVRTEEGGRVSDNDREWFEALFRAHYDTVLAYAVARADVETAKEATAQAFLVAWRRRADVPDRSLPWLIGAARRTLGDQRRSSRRRDNLRSRVEHHRVLDGLDEDPADDVAERLLVMAALADLAPADREVLQLVAWDGLSNSDAAAVVGCSPATFAVRLARARRRLAIALDRHDRATTTSVIHTAEEAPCPNPPR
jgi:RNA polymerase sigma-70 factor (ECF subfamily)